jgi:hypothetical protein
MVNSGLTDRDRIVMGNNIKPIKWVVVRDKC